MTNVAIEQYLSAEVTIAPIQSSTMLSRSSTRQLLTTALYTLSLVLVAFLVPATAQDLSQADIGEAPWSILSSAPYLADPTFNQGLYQAVAYPGPQSNSQFGKAIARLSNGDVVVAGIAPKFDGSLGAPPINLLMARYNAVGERVVWSNPGANGYQFDQYVVFPNTNNPADQTSVKDVLDIKVFGNRIFVLVDHQFEGGSDIDCHIHVFGTDGAFIKSTAVLQSGFAEFSGGMYIYGSGTFPETVGIAVVASTFNGVFRPTFVAGAINADSSITFNAPVFPNPGNYCPNNRGCILRAIAEGGRGSLGFPNRLYLAGTRQSSVPDNDDWDFLVMAVNFNGTSIASFGGAGVTTVPFLEGGTNYDDANSIEVATTGFLADVHDEIYVSGFVDRECKDGLGIAKLKDNGSLDTGFGKINGAARTGKLVLGGAIPPFLGACSDLPPLSTSDTYATDSALANGKLGIAGFTVKFNLPLCIVGQPCHEDDVDGMIAVIDTAHGDVDSFRTYPYMEAVNGPRLRHSGFWGITESGSGSFTATGDVRYFQTSAGQPAGANKFGTLRVRTDSIFAHGFE